MGKKTNRLVIELKEAGQDFEWYPTTDKMIQAVKRWIPEQANSIMDIGAGDGRVLVALGEKCNQPLLYSIEISPILRQEQPEDIIPVGTDLFEQNLAALPVDYIFCNPSYSQYEEWVCKIIEQGFAIKAFLVIPQRWKDSPAISEALKRRGATARAIYHDDFLRGDRAARAIIDIVEVTFPLAEHGRGAKDPFEIWFDSNISTFDKADEFADVEPSENNTNGIYAMKSRKSPTLNAYQAKNCVLVRLALSGTVVEANEGLRASHAIIVEVLS